MCFMLLVLLYNLFVLSLTNHPWMLLLLTNVLDFLEHLKLNSHHDILFSLYMRVGLQELSRLRDIKLHACAE